MAATKTIKLTAPDNNQRPLHALAYLTVYYGHTTTLAEAHNLIRTKRIHTAAEAITAIRKLLAYYDS